MAEFAKPAQVLLGGIPVLKAESSEMSCKSNDSPVYTLEDGLAGFSDGAHEFALSIKQAVPQSGFVIDWFVLIVNHTTVRPTFKIAGRAYEFEGRVMDARTGSKVNDPTMVDVSFTGRITGVLADA